MKSSLIRWCLLLTFALCASGGLATAAEQAQRDDALVVIVHPSTKLSVLSPDQLEAIFSLSQREWPSGKPIIAFNHVPGSELRTTFDRAVLRMGPDETARFWIDRRIRGLGDAPRKVPSVLLMLRVVGKLPGSIGYVPEKAVTADVKVVARIVDGRVQPPAARRGDTP